MKKIFIGLILTLNQFASAQSEQPKLVASLMTSRSSLQLLINSVNLKSGCAGISLSTENIVYQYNLRHFISSLNIQLGPGAGYYYMAPDIVSNRINAIGKGLIIIGLPFNESNTIYIETKDSASLLSTVQKYFGSDATMSLGYYDECPVNFNDARN